MNAHIGELAALGTAVSWTIAALVMEQALIRVGVMAVNTLKVAFGTLYLALLAFLLNGQFFPTDLSLTVWAFLGASGLIGFVIGDYFLLHAYSLVGSRMAMLLLSLSVPLTALGALALFGERPGNWALAGIALCVTGISLTVMAGRTGAAASENGRPRSAYRKGIVFGILSAVAMAGATLLTKSGAAGVDPVSGTQIRIISALFGFILFALFTGKTGEVTAALRHRTGLPLIALGGLFGPFIGVGFLLFALQHAEAGVVSTLSSLTPVLIIPPSILLFGRKVKPMEILGACFAVCGLALLFL